MAKTKTQTDLENASMVLASASRIAASAARAFPHRKSDEAWDVPITAEDLRERAALARQAADVMDRAAKLFDDAFEERVRAGNAEKLMPPPPR